MIREGFFWSLILLLFCNNLCWSQPQSPEFAIAKPNYQFNFPEDHFGHDNYGLEWWYFTGNLKSLRASREFGYELTFFKVGLKPNLEPVYIAHLALSDIKNNTFKHFGKTNREFLKMAGIDEKNNLIWNKNWQVLINHKKKYINLKAQAEDISLDLNLDNLKTPIIHGIKGENISRKGSCPSCASHYYSLINLKTRGKIIIGSETYEVTGKSWMDHEFGSKQLQNNQIGWDWLSLQLDDGSALMLYRMREENNKISNFSSGTYISKNGEIQHLTSKDFSLKPKQKASWKSPNTKTTYPLIWEILVPHLDIALKVVPKMINQEVSEQVNYWEGAVTAIDRLKGKKVGQGYLELTGYDGNLSRIPI